MSMYALQSMQYGLPNNNGSRYNTLQYVRRVATDNNSLSGRGRFESTNSNEFPRPPFGGSQQGSFSHRGMFGGTPGGPKWTPEMGGDSGIAMLPQEQIPLRPFGGPNSIHDDLEERRTVNSYTGNSVMSTSFHQQQTIEPSASKTVSMLYAMLFALIGCVLVTSKVLSSNAVGDLYIDIFGIYMFGFGFMFSIYVWITAATAKNRDDVLIDETNGSIYMRIGICLFFLATLAHNVLVIAENISYEQSCEQFLHVILMVLIILFHLMQLILVTRYSKVCIMSFSGFARLTIAHIVACNFYYWYLKTVKETEESIAQLFPNLGIPFICGTRDLSGTFSMMEELLSPLLFPLTVGYSLYCGLVLYRMWENIERTQLPPPRELVDEPIPMMSFSVKEVIFGLVFGAVSIITCLVTLVLYSIFSTNVDLSEKMVLYYMMSNIIWILVLIFLLPLATCTIKRHRKQSYYHNSLNRPLIALTSVGAFCYSICSAMSSFLELANGSFTAISIMTLFLYSLYSLQVAVQSIYLMDAMRRNPAVTSSSPSKAFILFFLMVNIALSISIMFELKETSVNPIQPIFYGGINWQILLHFVGPAACLYRIQSVFSFIDTWKFAY